MMDDPFEDYVVSLNNDLLDAIGDAKSPGDPELAKELAEKIILWHTVHGSHLFDKPKEGWPSRKFMRRRYGV